MRKLRFLTALILSGFFTGCFEDGSLDPNIKDAGIVQLKQISAVYYDTADALVVVSGTLNHESITLSNSVQFYTNSKCSGTVVGQGSYENFKAGVELRLSSQKSSVIYLKTNSLAYCMYLTSFSAIFAKPLPPVFKNFSPSSPSISSSTPLVFGQAAIRNFNIDFYNDSQCSFKVGSGSAEMFSTTGILLTLPVNQTTFVYGQTSDALAKKSECRLMEKFVHSSISPSAPNFTTSDPLSPNKITQSPVLIGLTSMDTVSISIYKDAGCISEVGAGLKADFESAGIPVTLDANTTTQLYAKAFDSVGRPSICGYLTSYTHDDIAPSTIPQFTSASPASPTRLTTYPKVIGTMGSSDAVSVILYSDIGCIKPIGTGSRLKFESSGILAGVTPNSITSIYGVNVDAAGNFSACVYLTDYKNNTIPPPDAVFSTSNPVSPNNITPNPIIFGNADVKTASVSIFDNETCTNKVGMGPGSTFDSAGISINLPVNKVSTLYTSSTDQEGNISLCNFLTTYAYSNLMAPAVGFTRSSPASPSRISTNPYFIGTAASTITQVRLYSDNTCSTLIGQSSRLSYTTTGIRTTVAPNNDNSIYARATDVYGNDSACTLLTSYIHCNVVPDPPTFAASNPNSPNRTSITPLISGTLTQNLASILAPAGVTLHDSFLCLNRIGVGTKTDFTGAGVQATTYANALVKVYAMTYDAAGNYSNCTLMLDYINDSINPGVTSFVSALPATPSYSNSTVVKGNVVQVSKVLPISAINIFSDNTCTTLVTTGSESAFTSTGIPLSVLPNSTTTLYGQSVDAVGNKSPCSSLISYDHKDIGPSNLVLNQNLNGSVDLTWTPDTFGNPTPTYQIKRALVSGGPYTILVKNNLGNNFVDNSVNNGKTYFYVVAASNNTGTTLDSAEAQISVISPNPDSAVTLVATPESEQIGLQWTGFPTDMNFKLYRSSSTGGPYTLIASNVSSSIYYDKTVTNSNSYYYVVTGVNPAGNSIISAEVSALALDIPGAPTNLTVSRVLSSPACNGGVANYLSWSPPRYFSRFSVNRGNSTGSTSLLTKVAGNSYIDCNNGFSLFKAYYTVQADWGVLQSADSNEVSVSTVNEVTLTVAPGDGEVFLSWTNIPTALSYDVYRSTSYNGQFTLISTGSAGAGFQDTSVINNTAYYYYVTAVFSEGYNAPSLIKSGVPGVAGGAPSNLTIFTDQNKLPNFDWTEPQKYNHFNIYRSNSVNGTYSFIGTVLTNTAIDSSPLAGMNFYKVSAVWGSIESAMTAPVSFRNGVPTGVTISSNTASITISWNAVPTATNYNVFRGTSAGGPYSLVSAVATSPFVDSSVALGTGYYYVVQAGFSDSTVGLFSSEVSSMTKTTNVPSGLSITATTTSSITFKWIAVPNATRYKIFTSASVNGTYVQDATMPTTQSHTLSGLTAINNVYIKIKSVVSGTDSNFSAAIQGQTITPPDPPACLPGNNFIDLTWNFSTGATMYDLERSTDRVNFNLVASGVPSTSQTDATATNGVLYYYRIKAYYGIGSYYSLTSSAVSAGMTPIPPRGLTMTDNSTGTSLEFAWADVPAATTFKLYLSTTSGGPYTLATNTSSTSQVLISSLTPDTTYFFVLTSLNGLNESAQSAEISAHTLAPTLAPSTKAVGPTNIDLTWAAIPGAASYTVSRSTDDFNYADIAFGIAGTTYSDTTAASGFTYKYKYLSLTASGSPMSSSAPSNWTTTTIAPLSPEHLNAQSNSSATVQLGWVPITNCSFYTIYRSLVAGGPYTLLNSVSSLTNSYTDTSVIAGSSYFYVVRAESSSGVESGDSNEAAIKMSSGPTSLAAALVPNKIQLSWNLVAGATGYTVRRALKTGGAYGLLASGVVGTGFMDAAVEHGTNYFYVVDAEFADGTTSIHSNEANVAAVDLVNLQVPIDLLDRGIASNTTVSQYLRSKTSFDTNFYDGIISYGWQVVAQNFDSNPVVIQLVNNLNVVVGAITVPAGTGSLTRFVGTFVPTVGADFYKLQLQATTNAGDLQVSSARLLITQQQASKTRIYIPLSASSAALSSSDIDGFLDETASTSFLQVPSASIYQRNTSIFSKLVDYNAWELETIMATTNGARGRVALVDETLGQSVGRTEGQFSSANPILVRSPFDEGEVNFSKLNENDSYEVRIRCEQNCLGGKIRLYKAGLWVTLSSLTRGEVYFRTALGSQLLSTATEVSSRTRVLAANFSNPQALIQAVGQKSGLADGQVTLMNHGNQESGIIGAVPASPTVDINSNSKALYRSTLFPILPDETYISEFSVGAQPISIVDSFLIIRFNK